MGHNMESTHANGVVMLDSKSIVEVVIDSEFFILIECCLVSLACQ
jgi:hypothetical protein